MLIRRLRYWMESAKRSEALREEMELHLAEKAAELQADGMTAERARAEARRRFGNVGLKHEESREIWMTRFLSELGEDVRYGCRTMAANKAFSALAVLSLALGIGANTTIYSFMESILLRSLPVADPESLVVLNWHSRPPRVGSKESVHVMHAVQGMAWPGDKGAMVSGMFPYGAFETLREENPVFSTLFGYFNGLNRNLAVRGQATSASTEYVTGEYFRGLAVSPAAGRLIDSEDDRPGAAPVAVISFATSQQRFGGPSSAIGQPVLVDNVPLTVIGVAPPEFFGVDPAAAPDLYLPLHTNLLVDGDRAARMYPDGNYYWIEMMGRLRPGVSMAQAQAALAPRFHQWVAATATTDGERAKLPAPMKIGAVTIEDARVLAAGPRFLTTMQIPILAGREIDDRDQPGSRPVAVISERLARTYFGNKNPVGRRITLPDEKRDLEIVGVSANLRYGGLKNEEESAMTVFVAVSQFSPDRMTYALRTAGDPLRYVRSVHEIVREADSRIPVTNVVTQAAEIDRTISREVTFAKLCTGFAVLALLMACVGLYGTMSYSVARQVGEIGIRMALGAQRGAVVWMVLRRVLLLAAVGLAISVPAALSASQLVKSFLFETQPNDPGTLALAGVVLLSAAILAGYAPARRASRIDPLAALRHE